MSNDECSDWYAKGIALCVDNNYERGISCFEKAVLIMPNFRDAWYQMGNAFAMLNKYEDAARCFDKAIEIDPEHGNSYINKSIVLKRLGRKEEAEICKAQVGNLIDRYSKYL